MNVNDVMDYIDSNQGNRSNAKMISDLIRLNNQGPGIRATNLQAIINELQSRQGVVGGKKRRTLKKRKQKKRTAKRKHF
jgi:hypothetical protein